MSKHPLYNTTGLQKNNKSHVLYALANKQMELKQLEDEYKAKIIKIKTDLSALETTICLFDENCNETITKLNSKIVKSVPKKRNSYFAKGECKKLILITLRTANEPLMTSEISLKLQKIKNIDTKDNFINKNIQKIVVEQLSTIERSRLVVSAGRNGLNKLWCIRDD